MEPPVTYRQGRFLHGWNGWGWDNPERWGPMADLYDPQTFAREDFPWVFGQFLRVAMHVADVWDSYNQGMHTHNEQPTYMAYRIGFHQMDRIWGWMVTDPTNPVPHRVRAYLAQVNLKGVWDMLWWAALEEDREEGQDQMTFILYRWLINAATRPGCHDEIRAFCRKLPGYDMYIADVDEEYPPLPPGRFRPVGFPVEIPANLLSPADVPAPEPIPTTDPAIHYFFNGGRSIMDDPEDMITDNNEEIPEGLEDVVVYPIGARIDTSELTTAAQPPAPTVSKEGETEPALCCMCRDEYLPSGANCVSLNKCGHVFHFDCLDMWLNSGVPGSGQCPQCRAKICRRRDNRLADQQ